MSSSGCSRPASSASPCSPTADPADPPNWRTGSGSSPDQAGLYTFRVTSSLPPTGRPRSHRDADAEFLGLVREGESGRFRFTVLERLSRLDGRLYGGTAIAVSIAAAEQVSDRPALWMTTQFVSTAAQDTELSVEVEVLAPGRRTHQVRVTGTDSDGAVVFASLGATGQTHHEGLTGQYESLPVVDPPDRSDHWASPLAGMARGAGIDPTALPVPTNTGFTTVVELRHPTIHEHPDLGPGRVCVWARRTDDAPITPALAAYLADLVPMSIAYAHGVVAMGTSLDNTIRIGSFVESRWVLIDLRPHLSVGGYGHGVAHVWSRDGQLMATASQTASMRSFDPAQLPWNAPS
jgi:acyl-CoA thioesterase-2